MILSIVVCTQGRRLSHSAMPSFDPCSMPRGCQELMSKRCLVGPNSKRNLTNGLSTARLTGPDRGYRLALQGWPRAIGPLHDT